MIRIVLFILLIGIFLTTPWYVGVACACVYALWWEGIELVVLGFFLDAYFGHAGTLIPFHAAYTIAFTGIIVFVWGIKPLLFFKEQHSLV